MRLSVAVQTHPARRHLLPPLLEQLPADTCVRVDPKPEVKGSWKVARLAWLAHHPEATHHLVIEDDVILCAHFWEAVQEATLARPSHVLSFYSGLKQIGEQIEQGKTWARPRGKFYASLAIVMPTAWIAAWVRAGDSDTLPANGVDLRMRMFRGRILLAAPCLVQHGLPADSLLWHNNSTRVTRHFADDLNIDPRTIDWNTGER